MRKREWYLHIIAKYKKANNSSEVVSSLHNNIEYLGGSVPTNSL